jgi:hypothetical protein
MAHSVNPTTFQAGSEPQSRGEFLMVASTLRHKLDEPFSDTNSNADLHETHIIPTTKTKTQKYRNKQKLPAFKERLPTL